MHGNEVNITSSHFLYYYRPQYRQKGTQVNDLTGIINTTYNISFFLLTPLDQATHPQYSPSAMPASDIAKASARTYFYQGEQKCDENMKNFLECINVAGTKIFRHYYINTVSI